MPLNHIYQIRQHLTNHLFLLQLVNGYRILCLLKESAIANHQLFKIVRDSKPVSAISARNGACVRGRNVHRHRSVSEVTLFFFCSLFWLFLITFSKGSETTQQIPYSSLLCDREDWTVTFLFSSLLWLWPALSNNEVFSTILYCQFDSNTAKKTLLHGGVGTQEPLKNAHNLKPVLLISITSASAKDCAISLYCIFWGFHQLVIDNKNIHLNPFV